MRDRLIELIKQGDKTFADKYEGKVMLHIDEVYDFIADYLLTNGVIVPPCKVGDKVYRLSTKANRLKYIQATTISRIAIDNDGIWLFCECNPIARCIFGKTIFLTKEEAEKALKGGAE